MFLQTQCKVIRKNICSVHNISSFIQQREQSRYLSLNVISKYSPFTLRHWDQLQPIRTVINQANNWTSFPHTIDVNWFTNVKMSDNSKTSLTSRVTKNDILEIPAQLAVEIFEKAVESVKPANLLKSKFIVEDNILKIDDGSETTINLGDFKRIFIVGFGKAVLPMAEEVSRVLGEERVERCMVNIPEGFRDSNVNNIEINRGAKGNLPDDHAYEGSKKIVQIVQDCNADDLLIVLITGGGSALLSYPLYPITVKQLSDLVRTLSLAGASIQELNSVRKRLSLVKGGGLLTLCRSSKIISLILSDVLGDPIDVIASGPTVVNSDPEPLAQEIISKYTSFDNLPSSIKEVLHNPIVSPPKSKDVVNSVIGNNTIALETAASVAEDLKLCPIILTNTLSGIATEVGANLGHMAQAVSFVFQNKKDDEAMPSYISVLTNVGRKLQLENTKIDEILEKLFDEKIRENYDGICLLFGGETTVVVKGDGVGGRNQELALSAGMEIDACAKLSYVKGKIAVLSAGTDGFDGPCDAAGAVIDTNTLHNGYVDQLSATDHRIENNSYNYFKSNSNGAYHIITGHTETNVMDLILIVVVK